MIISDRNEFTGTHLTHEAKEALRLEAEEKNKSMSRLIAEWVNETLRQRGYKLKEVA